MKTRFTILLALAVLAGVLVCVAAQAAPLGDNEVLVGDRAWYRYDAYDWQQSGPSAAVKTRNDWMALGTNPRGMAWAPDWGTGGVKDGNADIFAFGPDRLYVVDGATAAALCDGNSIITDGISKPFDVSVRGDYVYVLNGGNDLGNAAYVTRYNKFTGAYDANWRVNSVSGYARGIAVTADGSVYVASVGADGLQKFNSSGAFVGNVATSLGSAYGVREDWNGNLWVTDWSSADGGFGYINPSTGIYTNVWYGAIKEIDGLAFTPDRQNVLLTSWDGSQVWRFDTSGNYVSYWSTMGTNEPVAEYLLTTFNRSGNDLLPVPEPSSLLGLASGVMGLAGFAIRRRK